MQKFIINHKDNTSTLLHFIADKLEVSNKKAKKLLDKRFVFVNKKRAWIASYQLNKGDVVEIITGNANERRPLDYSVLFRDDSYLIISKPPYVLTNGPNSMETMLRKRFGNNNIKAAHRLDKNTSGAVVFAWNEDAFMAVKELFKKKFVKKIYRAIVKGCVSKKTFSLKSVINGQSAVTRIMLLESGDDSSYVEMETETGRKHQIRIHLASIGHPVLGETEYDRKAIKNTLHRQVKRQMLHAYRISFIQPFTRQKVSVRSPIPQDFVNCIKRLIV